MLNHLARIIGQPDNTSSIILDAKARILLIVKKVVLYEENSWLERRVSHKICTKTLFSKSNDKSLGWDEIFVEFFKEFWNKVQDPITLIASKAF